MKSFSVKFFFMTSLIILLCNYRIFIDLKLIRTRSHLKPKKKWNCNTTFYTTQNNFVNNFKKINQTQRILPRSKAQGHI